MFEEKASTAEQKTEAPRQPVDMFAQTQDAPHEEQESNEKVETQSTEQEDSHQSHSRRTMILALIGIVLLLIIIGGAVTFFMIFRASPKQPASIPLEKILEPEISQPAIGEEQAPTIEAQTPSGEAEPIESLSPEIPKPTPTVEAPLDTDNDGLSDEQEAQYSTDGNLVDTDGDGLTDREEVQVYKTNPVSADTDSDGFLDKQELDNGFDPNGTGTLPTGIPPKP